MNRIAPPARQVRQVLAAALLLLSASVASAQTAQYCGGKVSYLYVTKLGDVVVNAAVVGNYVQVCNINADWKGVSPVTCMGWVSLLRSAVSRNSDTLFNYIDAAVTSCASVPSYGSAPAPYYVMLIN